MRTTTNIPSQHIKSANKNMQPKTSYRGFASIDQEMEREIALQWLSSSGKSSFSERYFLSAKAKTN